MSGEKVGKTTEFTVNAKSQDGELFDPASKELTFEITRTGETRVAELEDTDEEGIFVASFTPEDGEEGLWRWEWRFTDDDGNGFLEDGAFIVRRRRLRAE